MCNFTTNRKSIVKLYQMNREQLAEFINLINDKAIDNILDLKDIDAYEKIDGQAFRLCVYHGEVGIETSYSGPVFDENRVHLKSFRDILSHYKELHKKKLNGIAKKYDTWFKVVGELLYKEAVDEDNTFTVVATKYDASKFGLYGGIVVFDVLGINEEGIYELENDKKSNIINEIKKLSDDFIKIYTKKIIKAGFTINFTEIKECKRYKKYFENPNLILEVEKDEFKAFRDALNGFFTYFMKKLTPVLGIKGSQLEGITFKMNKEIYSISNFRWKEIKNKNFYIINQIDSTIVTFYQRIFGFQLRKKLLQLLENEELYKEKYQQLLPQLKEDIEFLYRNFTPNMMPLNVYKQQLPFVKRKYEDIMSLTEDINSLRMIP